MTQVARWVMRWTLIAVLTCAPLVEVVNATGGPPPEAIRAAQELLAALGYTPGPADGVWGQKSVRAYRAFLRDQGRPVSDRLTPQALRVMRTLVRRHGGVSSPHEVQQQQQEEARRRQEEARRRQEEARRQQEEARRQQEEARRQQEEDDRAFARAQAAGTAAAYATYLSRYPQGRHAKNARRLKAQTETVELDNAAYARARSEGTLAAFRRYLSSYPRGRHANNARRLIENISKRERARRKLESLGLVMVRVEGGSFTMGCMAGRDANCYTDETPSRQVRLGSFEIGKYEVTHRLWQAVMGMPANEWPHYPRVATWHDVQGFINKLNAQTGGNYRLPTEAEWEYAARGGQRGRGYQFAGSNRKASVAWCNPYSNQMSTVGQKQPNELGLFDMSGNAAEWVQDWYGKYSSSSVRDPRGPASGSYRVIRGGSVFLNARLCRVATRLYAKPNQYRCFNKCYVGFRLVRAP